jgi:plasmid stabilization system protein ParE
MDALEWEPVIKERQQWQTEQIQSALRDADSSKFIQHSRLADALGVSNTLSAGAQMNILWAETAVATLRSFLEYNKQCSGAAPFERHFDEVVSNIEFLSERPQAGYPGRALGTREFSFISPIIVYRTIPGELHVLYELCDSKKGRPRSFPARA